MPETNFWLSIPHPYPALVVAQAGFDSVTLDMQHGLFDEAAVIATLMAMAAPGPRRLVRTPSNHAAIIGKVLDAGADGVIAPLVNTPADAIALAHACWYPPRGARSFGPSLAALRAGTTPYLQAAQDVAVWAMIETRSGLDHAAEIAKVDGITGLYVGPNDLALALGFGAGSDRAEPAMLDALAAIVTAAHGAGKQAGLFCASAAYARRMGALGFDMLTIASDTGCLAVAAHAALAEFAVPP